MATLLSFKLFPELPTEIRLMIWAYAMLRRLVRWKVSSHSIPLQHQTISLHPEKLPALNVCKESREETMLISERYVTKEKSTFVDFVCPEVTSFGLWFDPSQDILSLREDNLSYVGSLIRYMSPYFGPGELWLQNNLRYLAVEDLRVHDHDQNVLSYELQTLLEDLPHLPLLKEFIIPKLLSKRKSQAKRYKGADQNSIPYAVIRKQNIKRAFEQIQEFVAHLKIQYPAWNVPKIRLLPLENGKGQKRG
jgi:hypothetical protein